jgi:DNA-binding CsgD family transcriptional regulator
VLFRMTDLREELADLGGDITTALEDVPLPAALLDGEGIVRWQNRASLDRIGNVGGSDFLSVVAPDEVDEARDLLRRILCGGEPAELTLHLRFATGELEAREISAAPVREDGSVVGVFGLGVSARPSRRPGAKTTAPDTQLTGRQLEILQALAEGKSTNQIASELFLSSTTVRNHIANLLSALGVHTRLQAVVVASRAGLIDIEAAD